MELEDIPEGATHWDAKCECFLKLTNNNLFYYAGTYWKVSALLRSCIDTYEHIMPITNQGTDKYFLQWIHDRLTLVHGESPNMDYMHKLKAIIDATPKGKHTPNLL